MGNHKNLKVRYNEAALVFTKEGTIDIVLGGGPLPGITSAQAYAVCYAALTDNIYFELFKAIIAKDMIEKKEKATDIGEISARDEMIDLLQKTASKIKLAKTSIIVP